jgi:AraC-like DNA-binding protein
VNLISSLLQQKALPWATQEGDARLMIAGSQMPPKSLPEGVRLTRRKLQGRRVAVRGPREYANRSIVAAVWPSDHLIEMRDGAKLMCVVSGATDFQIGNQMLHCPAGYFLLVPPGVPHPDGTQPHLICERRDEPGQHCDLLWMVARGRGIQCWLCHSAGERHWGPEPGEQVFIFSSAAVEILGLLQEEADRDERCELACQGLLTAFLALLRHDIEAGRCFHHGSGSSPAEAPHAENAEWNPVQQAQRYIDKHLNRHLTIEKVARAVRLSRTRLTHRFRVETGQSLNEYITARRIEEAKLLLRESEWSIEYISHASGLSAPSYFAALFRRHTGLSPTAYRRLSRMRCTLPGEDMGR